MSITITKRLPQGIDANFWVLTNMQYDFVNSKLVVIYGVYSSSDDYDALQSPFTTTQRIEIRMTDFDPIVFLQSLEDYLVHVDGGFFFGGTPS